VSTDLAPAREVTTLGCALIDLLKTCGCEFSPTRAGPEWGRTFHPRGAAHAVTSPVWTAAAARDPHVRCRLASIFPVVILYRARKWVPKRQHARLSVARPAGKAGLGEMSRARSRISRGDNRVPHARAKDHLRPRGASGLRYRWPELASARASRWCRDTLFPAWGRFSRDGKRTCPAYCAPRAERDALRGSSGAAAGKRLWWGGERCGLKPSTRAGPVLAAPGLIVLAGLLFPDGAYRRVKAWRADNIVRNDAYTV